MSLAALIAAYTRTPIATALLDGKPWRGIIRLRASQAFGSGISSGTAEGRDPPVTPQVGMTLSWKWGYAGAPPVPGCTGEIAAILDTSYPDTWSLDVRDVLWRADKASQVIATDPLNSITATDAIIDILHRFGGIPLSRLHIPLLAAAGSAWGGGAWTLGVLTPVQWGDTEQNSGGTTALKAAQEICSCLGYWLAANAAGLVQAKLMERRPASTAMRTFRRGVDLLIDGAPERRQSYDSISNQVTVHGANTGVEGSQITDQFQTSHPLLPSGIYKDFGFSSFLIEYVNESEAGAASATAIARRILGVLSRIPDVISARIKADPRLSVGATIGIVDSGVAIASARKFFIYQLDTELDLQAGKFDQRLTLDGGVGSQGYTTIPPPDAAFSWRLMTETLDGTAVVEVFLDGSGSVSFSGEIVSWAWSTPATPYAGTPATATGVSAVLIVPLSAGTIDVTLIVTDTTSKQGSLTQTIDLSGAAETLPTLTRVVSAAAGAAWYVTPDGGATWAIEASGGDAVAVPPIGAGGDDRAAGTGATSGLLATRGAAGLALRRTLDQLATPSVALASVGTAIACLWVNEADPTRVWAGAGDTVYRSLDGGATFTAMAKPAAGVDVTWIIEDPAVDDSVFVAVGADLYHATAPTRGWVVLYAGPVGATARQFVRSRDGQVTWVGYTGTFTGDAAQRVETGAGADVTATTIRTLALDRAASGALATLYLVDGANPAAITTVDGLTGLSAVVSSQTFPTGAIVQHLIADPAVDVLYAADFDSIASGTGALRKFFPSADVLLLWKALATGQQGHRLGIGETIIAPARVDFVFGTRNISDPDLDGFWRYQAGPWTHIAPPAGTSGWRWLQIVASPFSRERWLAYGQPVANFDSYNYVIPLTMAGTATLRTGGLTPLWLTDDGGLHWQAVRLPESSAAVYGGLYSIGFQDQTGHWFAVGTQADVNGTFLAACVWRGTNAANATFTDLGADWPELHWAISGTGDDDAGGDILISEADLPGGGTAGRLAYLPSEGAALLDGSWTTDPARGIAQPLGPLDTIKGTRTFWQANLDSAATAGIAYWTDYRANDPASDVPPTGTLKRPNDVDGDYRCVAVGGTHLFIASMVGGSEGFYRRPHATWQPTGAPDAPIALVYQCVTSRQGARRVFVGYAAAAGVYQFLVHDGAAWASVALPDADLQTANAGASGIDIAARGAPFCALDEVPT